MSIYILQARNEKIYFYALVVTCILLFVVTNDILTSKLDYKRNYSFLQHMNIPIHIALAKQPMNSRGHRSVRSYNYEVDSSVDPSLFAKDSGHYVQVDRHHDIWAYSAYYVKPRIKKDAGEVVVISLASLDFETRNLASRPTCHLQLNNGSTVMAEGKQVAAKLVPKVGKWWVVDFFFFWQVC